MYVQYDSDTDILATALIFDMSNHVQLYCCYPELHYSVVLSPQFVAVDLLLRLYFSFDFSMVFSIAAIVLLFSFLSLRNIWNHFSVETLRLSDSLFLVFLLQ